MFAPTDSILPSFISTVPLSMRSPAPVKIVAPTMAVGAFGKGL